MKRCQDCKFWKKEKEQTHWAKCLAEKTYRKMNTETGKLEFVTEIGEFKISRYTRACRRFEQKDFRRTWKKQY